ncbi:MAG TPA: hypothetical protein VIT18_06030 [Terrimicrobiaceae bacterium]|jgi:hypothetical protein
MNNDLSTEVAGAIADALRETATGSQDATMKKASLPSPDSPETKRPMAGVLRFVAGLLSSSAVSQLFGAGSSEAAVLRGSLVGLASGVEAATKADSSDGPDPSDRRFKAIVTVSTYVLGGIAVALIVRSLRREDQTAVTADM